MSLKCTFKEGFMKTRIVLTIVLSFSSVCFSQVASAKTIQLNHQAQKKLRVQICRIPGIPRSEARDAMCWSDDQQQREADAWARSPHNPENQDPEIRGLNNSARHKFYGERGLMKLEQGDYARAISYFNKAVAINRFSSGVYHNRGLAKRKLNDLSGALADYNLAISLKESAESYAQRGFVKDSLNDLQGALEDYDKAISMELDPVTYFNRAYTKRRVNDRAGAIQDFREAARLFKQQGKTEDYQDTLNQLQKMNATL
jgi:tetratricopeptide (TPR) repeat protein